MKYRNIILIISILAFASCKEITKDDLQGNWIALPNGSGKKVFNEINFKENIIELFDDNMFKESGTYQLENGRIKIQFERDDLKIETEIKNLEAQTLLIFDSLAYYRSNEITSSNFEEYELMGISTDKLLSTERELFAIIHFYKSEDNEIRIRLGDKLGNYDDVSLFLDGGHSNSKLKVLIFIGEGISLKDLKNLYYRLISSGQTQVCLGTKREGLLDTHILKDSIEIWWEDLGKLRKSKLPPPPFRPIDFLSKESYLSNIGEEVEILHRDDFQKIEELENDKRYVVSISSDLTIEHYLELKKIVAEKKKINSQIITEIE